MTEQFSVYGSGGRTPDAALADGVVLKSAGPWASGVLALLRHLEDTGFEGAPRVVGDGYAPDGRLAVTYVPGSSPHPRAWPSASAAAEIGVLLRRLHTATRSFTPPPGTRWQGGGTGPVIGHRDLGPWNIVGDGVPRAFIDWESAGPTDPIRELAQATWLNAQLHDDDIATLHDLPDAETRARHAGAIVEAYGLERSSRSDFVDLLLDVALESARDDAVRYGVTLESAAAVAADGYPIMWGITWRARSAAWMSRNRRLLRTALRG
jgi:Ser/Thr protein kinase RdoA (MazF antagonist)